MRLTLRKAEWGSCKSYGCSTRYQPHHGCQCNSHGSQFSTSDVSCNRNQNLQAIISLVAQFNLFFFWAFRFLFCWSALLLQNSDLSEGSFLFHVIIVVPCCPPCGGEASAKNMATAAQTSPFAPRPPHQLQHQLQRLQQQSHRDKSMDIRTPPRRGLVLFGHGHGAFFEGMRRVKCWTKEVSTVDAIGNEATTLLSSCSWLSFLLSFLSGFLRCNSMLYSQS